MNKRALISVSDKTNICEFASELAKKGFELISTGGTAKTLFDFGLTVTSISEITDFPECLDGRVKTLHPKVHGALLAKRDNADHIKQIKQLNIDLIDILVVNLYPFKQTVQRADATFEEIIENIDIGGPAMLRSAAKNFKDVIVLVDPQDYRLVLEEIEEKGEVSFESRKNLAYKVFSHTAQYDSIISDYFSRICKIEHFGENLTLTYEKVEDLRYGENPHQRAAFYKEIIRGSGAIANAIKLHGKEMSFNNINDVNTAVEIVKEFDEPTIVAIKHANPCGVACGKDIETAFVKAYESDKVSIFGGIIASNREIDEATAKLMNEIFLEVVIAPSYNKKALEILTGKKNIRLLILDGITTKQSEYFDIKKVSGGILLQSGDCDLFGDDLKIVTERAPSAKEMEDLVFAWKVVKHVKSNAIVIAKNKQTLGIGAGQMNRIWAVEHSLKQAGENARSAVLASDAFFPFDDSVKAAAKAGIAAIIEPGGSLRDADSIKICNENDLAMIFTNIRHFKH